jgi:hypothetical protein
MPRKAITQNSAVPVGLERPTAKAELTIVLVDLGGRREPVRWQDERVSIVGRWKNAAVRLMSRQRLGAAITI